MLSEKLKKAMFNGRTLKGDFRRGMWKASELKTFKGNMPEDAQALGNIGANVFYYKGCVALYTRIDDNKKPVIGINNYFIKPGTDNTLKAITDDIVLELATLLMQQNNVAHLTLVDSLAHPTRNGGNARDIESYLSI